VRLNNDDDDDDYDDDDSYQSNAKKLAVFSTFVDKQQETTCHVADVGTHTRTHMNMLNNQLTISNDAQSSCCN